MSNMSDADKRFLVNLSVRVGKAVIWAITTFVWFAAMIACLVTVITTKHLDGGILLAVAFGFPILGWLSAKAVEAFMRTQYLTMVD